jgi:hypothetical protein
MWQARFARGSRRTPVPARVRLNLEPLERRCVPSVSAANAGNVFFSQVDGQVFMNSTSQRIDVNAVKVSAGISAVGMAQVPAAFIVYNNNQLFEWVQGEGFHFIDVNVADVSASLVQTDTVFIRYTNGVVFEHTGKSATSGFRFIDVNAVSIVAGQDTPTTALAYIVYNNGFLFRWTAEAGFRFIDVNVVQVSTYNGSPFMASDVDRAFIVYNNGRLFQWSPASGFQFIDVNVSQVAVGLGVGFGGDSPADPDLFIVYTNHELFVWNLQGQLGFQFIDVNVAAVGGAADNEGAAFIIYTNNELFSWQASLGFGFRDSNVAP